MVFLLRRLFYAASLVLLANQNSGLIQVEIFILCSLPMLYLVHVPKQWKDLEM